MKKKITAILFALLFVASIVWLILQGSKSEVLPIGSEIPTISFLTQNGRETITESNNKTLIILFSKDCPHCIYELKILNENIERLSTTKIYLLTADKDYLENEEISGFSNLLNFKNATFGIVNKNVFKAKFGSLTLPTLYFFNSERKLTAKIKGETKFERILKELEMKQIKN